MLNDFPVTRCFSKCGSTLTFQQTRTKKITFGAEQKKKLTQGQVKVSSNIMSKQTPNWYQIVLYVERFSVRFPELQNYLPRPQQKMICDTKSQVYNVSYATKLLSYMRLSVSMSFWVINVDVRPDSTEGVFRATSAIHPWNYLTGNSPYASFKVSLSRSRGRNSQS